MKIISFEPSILGANQLPFLISPFIFSVKVTWFQWEYAEKVIFVGKKLCRKEMKEKIQRSYSFSNPIT